MDGESKISGGSTYVLDEDDLDQLDELSLTNVIEEATDSLPQADQKLAEEGCSEFATAIDEGNTTINDLLRGPTGELLNPFSATDILRGDSWSRADPARETLESSDDLIAPNIIFPELSNDSDADS